MSSQLLIYGWRLPDVLIFHAVLVNYNTHNHLLPARATADGRYAHPLIYLRMQSLARQNEKDTPGR